MCCVKPRIIYIASVGGLMVCTVLCFFSVLLPGWVTKTSSAQEEEGEHTVYAGLFWICLNGTLTPGSCVSGNPFEDTALEVTTKFLVLVGLMFQTFSVFLALCHLACCCCCYCCCSCCRHNRHHHHCRVWHSRSSVVEVLAIGGGLIFFVGSLCTVGFVMANKKDDYTFGPSLFLAIFSSTLVVNFGCLIFISNRDPDESHAVFV